MSAAKGFSRFKILQRSEIERASGTRENALAGGTNLALGSGQIGTGG